MVYVFTNSWAPASCGMGSFLSGVQMVWIQGFLSANLHNYLDGEWLGWYISLSNVIVTGERWGNANSLD